MQNILLTGAAGFIGHKVAENLIRSNFSSSSNNNNNYNIIGIDNLNDYYDPRLKEHRLRYLKNLTDSQNSKEDCFNFYKVDIEDIKSLREIFIKQKLKQKHAPFDVVINLAARAGVRYSMENPHIYMTTNANGTLNLLELMREFGTKKIVLASTSSLYAGQPMPFKEDLPVNNPISPYAASKKAAELMCHSYHYLYGIDVTILRYFTVYGPAGRPDMSIYRFIKWIADGTPITLYGDGKQTRDFTFVDDIAEGTVRAAATTLNSGYEIINLGGGQRPTSLLEVIKLIEQNLSKNLNRQIIAKINHQPFHKADLTDTAANIEKAHRLLNGWSAKITIEEGVKKCVDWFLENEKFVQNLILPKA
ncbi:MAG: NAD-dependent epimerase/dehydratase family protein [Oligoflexia bacterium]|nr:NAD-dependent epimerase/dehydratase family protein [Oligoflexia bacterium]